MRPSEFVKCTDFPCLDVNKDCYIVPNMEIKPDRIRIIMISEAPPQDSSDYFYAQNNPFYMKTTAQAFRDAGLDVSSMVDVLNLGVYVTTAIKCGKTGYSISSKTVENCSSILETEMDLFSNVRAILLMGNTAIKAMNYMAKRNIGKRVIPSGSTYKIRRNKYFYKQVRVFPSYLQTGKSYLIEKTKRKMIAEDIKAALE
ncbi:MAG: uracil-DNA glycosylase [Candidatus Bathyarchaeota archaeon]|nr:uracil-DNA glycosylase [Candidatus Bathyarchaeota archaeon]